MTIGSGKITSAKIVDGTVTDTDLASPNNPAYRTLHQATSFLPQDDPDTRHCRARYRYQVYDGATGAVTNGQGTVEEIYKTVLSTPAGRQLKDMGCHVGISAGEFYLWWSEGGAGARSWVYYRTDSPIRFIQQPQQVAFESVDGEQFRRYLASRNVREFVAAGTTVRVIGPAVFSGDLPTEAPASARIASGLTAPPLARAARACT